MKWQENISSERQTTLKMLNYNSFEKGCEWIILNCAIKPNFWEMRTTRRAIKHNNANIHSRKRELKPPKSYQSPPKCQFLTLIHFRCILLWRFPWRPYFDDCYVTLALRSPASLRRNDSCWAKAELLLSGNLSLVK